MGLHSIARAGGVATFQRWTVTRARGNLHCGGSELFRTILSSLWTVHIGPDQGTEWSGNILSHTLGPACVIEFYSLLLSLILLPGPESDRRQAGCPSPL